MPNGGRVDASRSVCGTQHRGDPCRGFHSSLEMESKQSAITSDKSQGFGMHHERSHENLRSKRLINKPLLDNGKGAQHLCDLSQKRTKQCIENLTSFTFLHNVRHL